MGRKTLGSNKGQGTSPVLRTRIPVAMMQAAEAKAQRNGVAMRDVVRGLLDWWLRQPDG